MEHVIESKGLLNDSNQRKSVLQNTMLNSNECTGLLISFFSYCIMRRSSRNCNTPPPPVFCAWGVGNLTFVLAGWGKLNRKCN